MYKKLSLWYITIVSLFDIWMPSLLSIIKDKVMMFEAMKIKSHERY